ncbi:MAG: sensor histidine kinase [Candidatus Kapaibacterium sp.]|nr:MAG: sensor histidine kinase [Candidatus Kapabacteria bacterium]
MLVFMLTLHAYQSAEADVYQSEISIIHQTEKNLQSSSNLASEDWQREYTTLAKQYASLLNETMKITRISDSMQVEMRRLQQDLKRSLEVSETLREEAETANAHKTELLSIVAHDLKNPMGAIMGMAEILLSMLPEETSPKIYAAQIKKTTERTITLIKDLLDSAALDLGKIVPEFAETRLSLLLNDVGEVHYAEAENKEQIMVFDIQPNISIEADSGRLQQALDNLVSNAIKYSPHGTTIYLRLQRAEGCVRIEVQDEGQGFTDEDKEKLFGFFQRLSAVPTGGESSNGVGLAITKKIIDMHNGVLSCISEHGKGATFVIELPITQQHS